MFIRFFVEDFFIKNSNFKININGNVAKIENILCNKNEFYNFLNVLNKFENKYHGLIKINSIRFNESHFISDYIQKHSLFINEDFAFNKNFSIKENLSFQSKFWSGKDLSHESILSLGLLDVVNKNAFNDLSKEEINLLNLAKIIYCNSHIWFIPFHITDNIPFFAKELLKNIFEIRVRQGGLIVLFHY
jgi:ABC-type transport system involved in cytochrome c biogenesis ATPase subunit